jgi:hypothetical protein
VTNQKFDSLSRSVCHEHCQLILPLGLHGGNGVAAYVPPKGRRGRVVPASEGRHPSILC